MTNASRISEEHGRAERAVERGSGVASKPVHAALGKVGLKKPKKNKKMVKRWSRYQHDGMLTISKD
jgi:hypothetical protein